jgi:hypothetical protein
VSLGLRLARSIGKKVFDRNAGLASHQPSAKGLSPRDHLIDRPQDDGVTCVFDDHLTTLSKAMLLSKFSRQADTTVWHNARLHGVILICAMMPILSQKNIGIPRNRRMPC